MRPGAGRQAVKELGQGVVRVLLVVPRRSADDVEQLTE